MQFISFLSVRGYIQGWKVGGIQRRAIITFKATVISPVMLNNRLYSIKASSGGSGQYVSRVVVLATCNSGLHPLDIYNLVQPPSLERSTNR